MEKILIFSINIYKLNKKSYKKFEITNATYNQTLYLGLTSANRTFLREYVQRPRLNFSLGLELKKCNEEQKGEVK